MSTTTNATQTTQVTCINKINRHSGHEGITHLGGNNWKLTRNEVIAHIESGVWAFYSSVGGRYAWLRVVRGANGKYVQTEADGRLTNNLLALPECY